LASRHSVADHHPARTLHAPLANSAGPESARHARECGHPRLSGVLIVLVIALLGGFSGLGGGPFYGTGYYGGGGLGVIIVILLILVLLGRI